MIDTAGAYILILILNVNGGIATQEMTNFESCRAAVTQLEPIRTISAYCIAKDIVSEE